METVHENREYRTYEPRLFLDPAGVVWSCRLVSTEMSWKPVRYLMLNIYTIKCYVSSFCQMTSCVWEKASVNSSHPADLDQKSHWLAVYFYYALFTVSPVFTVYDGLMAKDTKTCSARNFFVTLRLFNFFEFWHDFHFDLWGGSHPQLRRSHWGAMSKRIYFASLKTPFLVKRTD